MAAPGLVQSNTAASNAAGPTSITPALGSASTAGNLLLLCVTVTGTSPTITTPASWTLVFNPNTAGFICALFSRANNPGGITSVAVTVGGTGGGAVASIMEFSNVGTAAIADQNSNSAGTGTTFGAGQGSSSFLNQVPLSQSQELLFYFAGFAATTYTPNNSSDFSAAFATAVSTNGTPNAQIACFWGVGSSGVPDAPQIAGSFGASVANGGGTVRYFTIGGALLVGTSAGGARGIYVGGSFQGMIGG